MCDGGVHTLRRAHICLTHFSLRGAQISRTRMAQGVCSARVVSHRLTFSCFIHRLCCSRTVTSTRRPCLHLPCRTGRSDALHKRPKSSTRFLINDPNYDNISDFSKITREKHWTVRCFHNVRTFLMVKAKTACIGKPLLDRERERGKGRFCDQCCRVDVKEKSTEQYWESFSSDSQRILF